MTEDGSEALSTTVFSKKQRTNKKLSYTKSPLPGDFLLVDIDVVE